MERREVGRGVVFIEAGIVETLVKVVGGIRMTEMMMVVSDVPLDFVVCAF
jgi:hypothetical protein